MTAFEGKADIASGCHARKNPAPQMGPAGFPGSGRDLHCSDSPDTGPVEIAGTANLTLLRARCPFALYQSFHWYRENSRYC